MTAAFATVLLAAAILPAAAVAVQAAPHVAPSPDLGKAAGQCRPGETGPALIVTAVGVKDRRGLLRAELYPANDDDFLADDNVLVMAGKTFARVEVPVAQTGPVQLCLRIPAPGAYTLSLLHDRDGNRKFGLSSDGIGFPGNPKLGFSKPRAAKARLVAGAGLTPVPIRMNYRRGLFSFRPLEGADE